MKITIKRTLKAFHSPKLSFLFSQLEIEVEEINPRSLYSSLARSHESSQLVYPWRLYEAGVG
jgi:hypothetical protein